MRPLLMMLGDYRSLTLNVVNRLTSVTRLFPNSFNDKFCDQMMVRQHFILCVYFTTFVCLAAQNTVDHGKHVNEIVGNIGAMVYIILDYLTSVYF